MPGSTPRYPWEFKREALLLYRFSEHSIPKEAQVLPEDCRDHHKWGMSS